jgi:hypothetical protein
MQVADPVLVLRRAQALHPQERERKPGDRESSDPRS